MELVIPSDFMVLSLFEMLIKYEDRKSIKIDDIYPFLMMYRESLQNNYKDGYIPEEYENQELFFTLDSFNLADLFTKYRNLFHIYKDDLYINKALHHDSLVDLMSTKISEERIPIFFTAPLDPEMNKEIFNMFGVHSIENFTRSFLKTEKELETLYSKLHYSHSKELYLDIKKHLMFRYAFLNYIKIMPIYKIEAFDRISNMISNEEENYEYEVSPINMELWKKRKIKKGHETDFINDIDSRIYDIDQYAIFSNKSFADLRINKALDEIHFSIFADLINGLEQYGDSDYEYEEPEEEDNIYTGNLAFNLLYLKKLRLYMEKYGVNNNLLDTYNRLLYATDSPELCLYLDKYITEEFNNLYKQGWDKEELSYIREEARFLSYEIFTEEENEYTTKKLLFLSSYYDLTKDEKIINVINKHKNNKNFKKYTEIIFGNNGITRTLKK